MSSGKLWAVAGVLVGVAALAYAWWRDRELDKREEGVAGAETAAEQTLSSLRRLPPGSGVTPEGRFFGTRRVATASGRMATAFDVDGGGGSLRYDDDGGSVPCYDAPGQVWCVKARTQASRDAFGMERACAPGKRSRTFTDRHTGKVYRCRGGGGRAGGVG